MSLALALVCGMSCLIGGGAFVLPRLLRAACPVCRRRATRLVDLRRGYREEDDGARLPFVESRYRCGSCDAELIQHDRGPLITREAWAAGVRTAVPTVTLVKRRP